MSALVLHATLPDQVAGDRATFEGRVTLLNGGGERVRVTAAVEAGVHVIDAEGRLAAAPPPRDDAGVALDLPPGARRAFPARGGLVGTDGRRLAAGRYGARAVLELVTAAGDVVHLSAAPSQLLVR